MDPAQMVPLGNKNGCQVEAEKERKVNAARGRRFRGRQQLS